MAPSNPGCQTCKTRHIKCDGAKPACQRCIKSSRVCLDAEAIKQICFSIHSENVYASGRMKRPRGPRSGLTLLQPQVDLHTRANTYLLQRHLHTPRDVPVVSETLSECLYVWKASGKTSLIVDLALSSMALATFSRTKKHPSAATDAASKYHRLLRIMQATISQLISPSVSEKDIDDCLLATSLMGKYEETIYEHDHRKSLKAAGALTWCHDDGIRAILKIWNDNLSHRRPATSIIKRARRSLIETSLIRNLPLPEWLQNGNQYGEQELELDYDQIILRTNHLRHVSIELQQERDPHISLVNVLINQARNLDQDLQHWASRLPGTWSYQRHTLTKNQDGPKLHFYSPSVYSCNKIEYAANWSHYFAMRMLINDTWLRLGRLFHFDQTYNSVYEKEHRERITDVTTMADSLASTIPFCLDKFMVLACANSSTQGAAMTPEDKIKPHSADLVVWPLTVASSLGSVDTVHRIWFRAELAALGRATGSSVLELAETDEWISL